MTDQQRVCQREGCTGSMAERSKNARYCGSDECIKTCQAAKEAARNIRLRAGNLASLEILNATRSCTRENCSGSMKGRPRKARYCGSDECNTARRAALYATPKAKARKSIYDATPEAKARKSLLRRTRRLATRTERICAADNCNELLPVTTMMRQRFCGTDACNYARRVARSQQPDQIAYAAAYRAAQTPTLRSFRAMHQRCNYASNIGYENYGGRGITICERWAKFENFLTDMGERPEGTTLDRLDVNGNYEPNNCRWATPEEQAQNRRPRYRADEWQVIYAQMEQEAEVAADAVRLELQIAELLHGPKEPA